MRLLFTEDAEDHLEAAYNFREETTSQRSAAELYNNLIDGIQILIDQPHLGRIEPLLEDAAISYRSLILLRDFKVIYHIDDQIIVVAAVYNCRQEPEKLREVVLKTKIKGSTP